MDQRLETVASAVRKGSRVADIGTDHAYLPIALVKRGICPSALACDIRKGPLENAKRSVAEARLTDAIDCRLGDGLAPIAAEEADDIVIAGMGGETIVAILQACDWIADARYRLILQPMTRIEELRRYLLTHGFEIEREDVAHDSKHWYTVLSVGYTGRAPETDETAFYRGALCGEDGRAFLNRTIAALRCKERGLSKGEQTEECARLRALIEALEETV